MDRLINKTKNSFSIQFVIIGMLCTLWYTTSYGISDALLYTAFATGDFFFTEMLIGNFFLTIGLLVGAFICDGIIKIKLEREKLCGIFAISAAAFTLARYFFSFVFPNYSVYYCTSALSYIVGAMVFVFLFYDIMRKINEKNRAFLYGIAIGIAYILRMPADAYTSHTMFGSWSGVIFTAYATLTMLVAGVYVLCSKNIKSIVKEPCRIVPVFNPKSLKSLIWIGLFCTFAAGILYSLFNMFTINNGELEQSMLIFRTVQAVSAALSGYLCMKFGRHIPIILCTVLFGLGILAHWFSYTGAISYIFISMTITALFFFAVPVRTMFVDIAGSSKYPGLVSNMGLLGYHLFQVVGLLIFKFISGFEQNTSFVLYIAVFILFMPLITLLFSLLRSSYIKQAQNELGADSLDSLIQKHNFTKRESEIFVLLLQGLSTDEMARNLFVSDNTIRWHMSNVIKKTGVESRLQLIEMYKSVMIRK